MTKLVNVSRKKAIFRVLAFFEIIFVIATIAVLFLPYFSESVMGEKGDAKTIFDFLKDIFEIENAELSVFL